MLRCRSSYSSAACRCHSLANLASGLREKSNKKKANKSPGKIYSSRYETDDDEHDEPKGMHSQMLHDVVMPAKKLCQSR